MSEDSSAPKSFIAPSIEELEPLFPSYAIESFIAEGGMGAVYKARQKSLDRPVAIKILPREFGADAQFRESFEAEAKAMARLNHPNLIGVYDFGDVDGMLFIIMEHVKGKALYYSIHQKAIEPETAIKLISQISRGIAHAHAGGILHRDIKPANILLDIDATPKVGDFGLARPLDNERGDLIPFGTPGYTAPEVYTRQYSVDQRSDIFSIGAMLYELLKGSAPQENATNLVTGLDPRLDHIISKATDPDPNQRPNNLNTFVDEIENFASILSQPQLPQPQLAPPRPVTPLASSKSSTLPLVVLLSLILIGALAAYLAFSDKDPTPEITQKDEEPVTPSTDSLESNRQDNAKNKLHPKDKQKTKEKSGTDITKKETPSIVHHTPPEDQISEPKFRPNMELKALKARLASGERDKFPTGTIIRGDSAYFLFRKRATWREAYHFAQEHGASLASLKTNEELTWIKKNFRSPVHIWLGATDFTEEGTWQWLDQSPFDNSLWAEGVPVNHTDLIDHDFATLSRTGLEPHNEKALCTSLFEWKMDGSNPGSQAAQISRTAAALAENRVPTFPPLARNFEGTRYLLIRDTKTFQEAHNACTAAGGHLAVFSSQAEADYVTNFLSLALQKKDTCWLGAYRHGENLQIWKTTTGETMAFYPWLNEHLDLSNKNETALEYTIALGSDEAGCKSQAPSNKTTYYLLEWSHPTKRNFKAAPLVVNADFQAITRIREDLLDHHGRSYKKTREANDELVSDWVADAIRWVERESNLEQDFAKNIIAELNTADTEHKLPEKIPQFTPNTLRRSYRKTQENVAKIWEDYQEDFADAKLHYLGTLREQALKAQTNGNIKIAALIERELEASNNDDSRLRMILDGNLALTIPEAK